MLRHTGEDMLSLSERIGKGDKPLEMWEKSLARSAMLPAVQEGLDIVLLEYIRGETPDILKEFEI